MYKKFFGITHNPFDLTPDPNYFVSTKKHSEALAALYYGIRWHRGFVVVTGEVGTGKTLLLRCLLRLLQESKDISYAYLFNSRLSSVEFLQYILSDFGLPASGKNKCELLLDLGRYLSDRGEKKLTTVLVVDEAHHLSEELLEEIRLLTNLETFDDKLLQILLVGQPELDDKLDSHDLRQLKQRIAIRAKISSLSSEETNEYIRQRLLVAGADPLKSFPFPAETCTTVYRHSHGLPRLINSICDNALIAAFSKQSQIVTPDIIEEVAEGLRLDTIVGQPFEEHTSKPAARISRVRRLRRPQALRMHVPIK